MELGKSTLALDTLKDMEEEEVKLFIYRSYTVEGWKWKGKYIDVQERNVKWLIYRSLQRQDEADIHNRGMNRHWFWMTLFLVLDDIGTSLLWVLAAIRKLSFLKDIDQCERGKWGTSVGNSSHCLHCVMLWLVMVQNYSHVCDLHS